MLKKILLSLLTLWTSFVLIIGSSVSPVLAQEFTNPINQLFGITDTSNCPEFTSAQEAVAQISNLQTTQAFNLEVVQKEEALKNEILEIVSNTDNVFGGSRDKIKAALQREHDQIRTGLTQDRFRIISARNALSRVGSNQNCKELNSQVQQLVQQTNQATNQFNQIVQNFRSFPRDENDFIESIRNQLSVISAFADRAVVLAVGEFDEMNKLPIDQVPNDPPLAIVFPDDQTPSDKCQELIRKANDAITTTKTNLKEVDPEYSYSDIATANVQDLVDEDEDSLFTTINQVNNAEDAVAAAEAAGCDVAEQRSELNNLKQQIESARQKFINAANSAGYAISKVGDTLIKEGPSAALSEAATQLAKYLGCDECSNNKPPNATLKAIFTPFCCLLWSLLKAFKEVIIGWSLALTDLLNQI